MASVGGPNLINIAIELCTEDELKNKITSLPEASSANPELQKIQWTEEIELEAETLLQINNYDALFMRQILGVVHCTAMRMLTWVEYYQGTFDLPRHYLVNLLTPTLFTSVGTIDEFKVAEILTRNTNLSVMQQFKLGCHYCFKDLITLFNRLTAEEKALLYHPSEPDIIRQPRLVKFWSYFAMGEIDKLKGEKSINQYRLECAVDSGNMVAVNFCLEKTSLVKSKDAIVESALEVVKHRVQRAINTKKLGNNIVDDWVIFGNEKYDSHEHSWIPNHFFVDLFYYLTSKLTPDQKTDVVRRIFVCIKIDKFPVQHPSGVLEYFLLWPFQDLFMQLLHFSWEWLPDRAFGNILLEIVDRIELTYNSLYYGEQMCYDYRNLLMTYWISSPFRFKRYMFSNSRETSDDEIKAEDKLNIREPRDIFQKIFKFETFSQTDMENIRCILNDANIKEKFSFLFSKSGKNTCMTLISIRRLDILNKLIGLCCPTDNDAQDYKKKYSLILCQDQCLNYVRQGNWTKAEESLTSWCHLTEEEIKLLKRSIAGSKEGREICRDYFPANLETVELFLRWFFDNEEERQIYKKTLLDGDDGLQYCKKLAFLKDYSLLDSLINWVLPSEEEIFNFKQQLPYRHNYLICEDFIVNTRFDGTVASTSKTHGWIPVDNFLNWCNVLKDDPTFKYKLHQEIGESILFKLIESDQWNMAEEFFSWIGFSESQTLDVKQETFYGSSNISDFLEDILTSSEDDNIYELYGSKQNAIEKFLLWFLYDLQCVKEFRARYRRYVNDEFIRNVIDKIEAKLKRVFGEQMEIDPN